MKNLSYWMANGIGVGENQIGDITLQDILGMCPTNKLLLNIRMEGDANLPFKMWEIYIYM